MLNNVLVWSKLYASAINIDLEWYNMWGQMVIFFDSYEQDIVLKSPTQVQLTDTYESRIWLPMGKVHITLMVIQI